MKGETSVITPASFKTLGDLLRYLREHAHLSQRELAAQVNYHYSYISRIEKNAHIPDVSTLLGRFAPALNVDDKPDWITRIVELASAEQHIAPVMPTSHDSDLVSLPIPFTAMLGREREADALWEMLRRADIRLVTLVGPPGVGKTRLAIHAAGQVASWFPDGVIFADLAPVTDALQVIPAIASAFGILEITRAASLASLQSRLRNQRILLVLDNFEQVMAAAPQVTHLLTGSAELKILVTSREALRLSAEHVFPLQPLPLPETSDLTVLLDMPVIRLFVERARAVRPDFVLTNKNAPTVVEICVRLDGLPLAIELAAARVNLLTPHDMLDQFDRRFQWLTDGMRDSHAWRQTLRGAVEWSYNLLDDSERALLRCLSIFSGGWTLQAAETINSPDTIPLLMKLVNKSLVVSEPEHGRYHLLETIREFAHEKLVELREEPSLRARHLAYYADWAEDMESKLDTLPLNETQHLADSERNNLYAALNWALENKSAHRTGLRLITAASWIWFRHSHFSAGVEWAERFLPLSTEKKFKFLRARLLYRTAALAEFAYWRAKQSDIKAYFQEAEVLARELDDKRTLAYTLYLHTDLYLDGGKWDDTVRSATESISLCRELAVPRLLCLALSNLGLALHGMGKKTEARAALDDALQITTREKYVREEGYTLRCIVHNLRMNGEYAEAVSVNQRALEAVRASGDRFNIGQVLVTMAILTNALDDFAASGQFAQESYDMFQSIGSEFQQPFPERLVGYAALHQGDTTRARALCLDSIKRNLALGEDHKVGVFGGLVLLAEIELAENNSELAARLNGFISAHNMPISIPFQEPDARALGRLRFALEHRPELQSAQQEGAQLLLEQLIPLMKSHSGGGC